MPDILYFDELETQHAHLLDMGLVLGELSAQTMLYAMELVGRVRGPSRNYCFALALARQQNCPLLSGDEALRKAARHEAVDVKGTLHTSACVRMREGCHGQLPISAWMI